MFSAALPSSEVILSPVQNSPWKSEPATKHEVAKLVLRRAGTLLQRYEAIKAADRLGMPLGEIGAYLDRLDFAQDESQN